MFDTQFPLASEIDPKSASNDNWPNSFDRFVRQHEQQQQQSPFHLNNQQRMDDLSFNSHIQDVWEQPRKMQNNDFNMFNDFLDNYHYQQQQQQHHPPPPVDIATFLSSSPSTSKDPFLSQQPNRSSTPHHSSSAFLPVPTVPNRKNRTTPDNNYDFGLPPPSPPTSSYFKSTRSPPTLGTGRRPLPSPLPRLPHRSPSGVLVSSHQKQRSPPVLQVPNDEAAYFQQYQYPFTPQKQKHNHSSLYVPCINHGSNYNGVLGPPILLPPSF
ncbi:unnamed protein product [Didymodactylos carnosus]|uniref:Uncharacterized protein n=1 Tax=Didymodactylos carnosus TaxID=1234261 RepID=A0A813XPJ0_9BILA|nr:unnamed protein product [Didymodactylos carnosus]CAF0873506.1 unnamed protein product [Didymodactylos carnosus]CAF3502160.1 unnamed protein product [Didymodactylos carnosus]CAF3660726.1 unnamed protein product [Didymodactylos carnosus]